MKRTKTQGQWFPTREAVGGIMDHPVVMWRIATNCNILYFFIIGKRLLEHRQVSKFGSVAHCNKLSYFSSVKWCAPTELNNIES
jgi:hypothetical protein